MEWTAWNLIRDAVFGDWQEGYEVAGFGVNMAFGASLANDVLTVRNSERMVAGDIGKRANLVVPEAEECLIPDLSNKAIKHSMNDHIPARYANQLQYMNKESVEQYLSYKTFFNANWTDAQVKAALNFGYKEALNSGVTTGKYSFSYLGENVTVCLENGMFKTGYGDYTYTYDELLKLLGGN